MEIVYEEASVKDLIERLEEDLKSTGELRALARLPEPSRGRRYREVLYHTFARLGTVMASVILEYKDGRVKDYVFLAKAIPTQAHERFIEMPVYAEGYLIEKSKDKVVQRIFSPLIFKSGRELFEKVKDIGDRYRVSDYEVHMEYVKEYLDYGIP